ncbi:DUF2206 domain-containing protein [Methanobacterium sp.]|uniref:DUF2206 domain-containing protein n=1 Tax=Methanobacterium sp. TaxID=2164 RepID=UPI003C777BFF
MKYVNYKDILAEHEKIQQLNQFQNPLQMNDWNIKSLFGFVAILQFLLLGLISLDYLNIHIPIIRELLSFVYLTFIPGILILRILKLHELGNAKTIVYSIGLSIGVLMLTGLFMNVFYPFFGILKPISLVNILITISLVILILCFFSYLRDKDFSKPNFIYINEILSPSLLVLCLIPFLSIFGTYLLNGYGNNALQLVLLLVIAIFPLITLKWTPNKLYSLVIFIISLSILWHTTLISGYVWGIDLNAELITANFVVQNGLWISSITGDYNALLSIVMLAPIYSIFSNLNLVWCFKIIYPLIFSFVPVGLYIAYNELTNNPKMAFLACFFFINVNSFFNTLPGTARQEIAGLFLALILMLVVDRNIKNSNSFKILLLIFGFLLVVSHYGVTWILLLIIGVSLLILFIFNKLPSKLKIKNIELGNHKMLNYTFPLFLLFAVLAWYILVSNASNFENVTGLGSSIINSINDLLNPNSSQGLSYINGSLPYLQSIERYIYIICDMIIGIGIVNSLFNNKINPEFKALSIASFLILILGIVLPYFSAAMNTDRLFHINLFFLSIFFVIGFMTAIKSFNLFFMKIFKYKTLISLKNSFYIIATFLLIFSVLNTALVYQILDQPKIGKFALDKNQDFFEINSLEANGIEWFVNYNDPKIKIFADVYKSPIIENFIYMNRSPPNFVFLANTGGYSVEYQIDLSQDLNFYSNSILSDSYVFFGTYNINHKNMLVHCQNGTSYIHDPELENRTSKIYDNGGSWILKGIGS